MFAEVVGSLSSAFMLGLLGGTHCIAMCGGLASALGMQTRSDTGTSLPLILGYNAGRLLSYSTAGAVIGLFGLWLGQHLLGLAVLRYAAGAMLILMGAYLGGWFNGLMLTEKLGHVLWRRIAPLSQRLLPIQTPGDAVLVGLVWGWLPCGLVYSALVYASTSANPLLSAATMLAFGLGTLPAMLLTGLFAEQLKTFIQGTAVRQVSAVAMVLFGLWTLPVVHGALMQHLH